jgi:hypothetical protein
MPKFILLLILLLLPILNLRAYASTSRVYDFNRTSDLTDYFNPDNDPQFTNESIGGLNLSGSIKTQYGIEEIWVTKKGFNTTGVGDLFEISGYFYNDQNSGYGNIGLTTTLNNTPDMLGSPEKGVGFVFHGGGSYLVNNRTDTSFNWGDDLDFNSWYKVTLSVENMGANKFVLTYTIYKANEVGQTISFKDTQVLEVTNSDLANASKLYAYFGTADTRFYRIDNFEVEVTQATLEEEGKPIVSTVTANSINSNTAITGGEVTSEMGSSVTAKGVCYSTSSNPTISGTCTSDGSGSGSFTSNLSSLNTGTLYYYRLYATNGNGTAYGEERSFRTLGTSVSSTAFNKTFKKDTRCLNKKPQPVTWMKLTPEQKDGKKGMLFTWSQLGADRVTIQIDNGTGKFPYRITKTKNDGKEFLPNVSALQKVRIIPHNGCRTGEVSPYISRFLNPVGYFMK